MSNDVATTSIPPNPVVAMIRADKMQAMVQERLGKRAGQFTTSLISLVNANQKIAECTPITVIQAALTAASMDLPINQNLGFAYIVPYANNKKMTDEEGRVTWTKTMEAQFQMGWKGFVQLAQRSGKFKTINTTDIREGEVKDRDRMTGELTFDWLPNGEREKAKVVGYLAYFKLLNGFDKSLYMTKDEIESHAGRYSQAYKAKGKSSFKSPWETDFDLMAQKTVLKLLLSKFAPLSTEMQEAITVDQSVDDGKERHYLDNDPLADVNADDDKKKAIVAAHKKAPDNVDTVTGEILDPPAEDSVDHKANVDAVFTPPATDTPAAEPKKSVKDKVAERGWDGKGKQTKLVEDDKNS